jgi:hypothetical protein
MEYSFLLHNVFIEVFLLICVVSLYYIIPKDNMAVCLLGSYITLKAGLNAIHYLYHVRKHKQTEQKKQTDLAETK